MKGILPFILINIISIGVYGQTSFCEESIREYLNKNKESLNPIEGIWNINSTYEHYRNDTLIDVIKSDDYIKVSVVKSENKFETYNAKGEHFNVEFTTTDVNGVYLYRNYYPEISDYSKAQAVISNHGEMEYTFDYPEEYMRVKHNDMYRNNMRIVNILKWTKINSGE